MLTHVMNILTRRCFIEEIRIEWILECYELNDNVKDSKDCFQY